MPAQHECRERSARFARKSSWLLQRFESLSELPAKLSRKARRRVARRRVARARARRVCHGECASELRVLQGFRALWCSFYRLRGCMKNWSEQRTLVWNQLEARRKIFRCITVYCESGFHW